MVLRYVWVRSKQSEAWPLCRLRLRGGRKGEKTLPFLKFIKFTVFLKVDFYCSHNGLVRYCFA